VRPSKEFLKFHEDAGIDCGAFRWNSTFPPGQSEQIPNDTTLQCLLRTVTTTALLMPDLDGAENARRPSLTASMPSASFTTE
jgi:hypothetical protein